MLCAPFLENVARLESDSGLLLTEKRYASALVLLVVAWEELGKVVLLLRHYKNREDMKGDAWKKVFRDHRVKQIAIFHSRDLLWHKPSMLNPRAEQQVKALLRWTKETLGLYVNWNGRRKAWSCPRDDMTPRDVIQLLFYDVIAFLPSITKQVNEALLETQN